MENIKVESTADITTKIIVNLSESLVFTVSDETDGLLLWNGGFYGGSRLGKNPFKLPKDELVLSWEEAIFLSWALKKITISFKGNLYSTYASAKGNDNYDVDDTEIWWIMCSTALERSCRIFCKDALSEFISHRKISSTNLSPRIIEKIFKNPFITRYIAYHYYRSLGWVVRDGLNYASDFTLYETGPTHDHAECGVHVLTSIKSTFTSLEACVSALDLVKRLRVVSQVKKFYRICIVEIDLDETGINGIDQTVVDMATQLYTCPSVALNMYKVREIHLSRWIPEKNRV